MGIISLQNVFVQVQYSIMFDSKKKESEYFDFFELPHFLAHIRCAGTPRAKNSHHLNPPISYDEPFHLLTHFARKYRSFTGHLYSPSYSQSRFAIFNSLGICG